MSNMIQSSSSSSQTQGQGPSGSGNQLIAGIRNRRVYQNVYNEGANEYLPYNVKNQARYMGFIQGQPKAKLPRQNITFENITARVGNGTIGERRKAQQRALAEQVGPGLMHIVGRLSKDIKRVKALVNEQSAQNWIKDRGLKDWKVQTEDLDKDKNTPKNVIVTNPSGFYSIDGYRAVEPKQRFLLSQYYGKQPTKLARSDHNYGSWYDQTIKPLIPDAVGKQLFSEAVQIVLKSMGHSFDENNGRQNQALRRQQQLTFLKLAPFLWKSYFIGTYAAANAPEQAKQAFTQANYFKMYNETKARKQNEAINKQAINVFNGLYDGKPLAELTELYDQIKAQIQKANVAIESGEELGFVLNFITQKLNYETAIHIISHSKAMKKDQEDEEQDENEAILLSLGQVEKVKEKQEQDF
ncbi:MAG: hypothetical protein EZS28_013915 [Streblomastix strix]|uniref:Uncharacterized protein n=1 Tax=Streblomastix strix TaxID=222440 RepID=A0A5J4W6K8_9EUKA|nr:MAG: hypothetical protein EZS28_013915 [Streblomastix strix]